MKKLIFAILAYSVLSVSSSAITTVDADDLLGWVDPSSPANPSDELGYLVNLINFYNAPNSGTFSVGTRNYEVDAGSNIPAPNLATPLSAAQPGNQ